MKKKFWAGILVMIILCLSGCNPFKLGQSLVQNQAQQNTETEENIVSDVQTESVEETVSEEIKEDISDDSEESSRVEEVVATSEYLDICFERYYDSYYDEVQLMYGYYDVIRFNEPEYPALTEAVREYSDSHADTVQTYLDEMEQWAKEEYEEYGQDMYMGAYGEQSKFAVRRADTQVLSIVESNYTYAGGAHGVSGFSSVNFDVATGEEIALESVVKDLNSLPAVLTTEILEKYPDITYWTDTLEETFQKYVTSSETEYVPTFVWTLDYEGVTFYFGNYEIGSYADGLQVVTIFYKEYPQLLEDGFFTGVSSDYVLKLSGWSEGSDVDLNGDGVKDYIAVTRNYSSEPGVDYSESYNITVNGNTITREIYCYELETYLVKAEDKYFLYVKRKIENDYESVCVFHITENSVEYVGEFSGGFLSFTNSLDFELTKRMDLLSTYSAVAKCYVGADGMPVEKEGVYIITNPLTLTSTVEISADLVDENGNLTGETATFLPGTDFTLQRTDGKTYVDVLSGNGQWCRFYTTSDWPPTVNGMDATSSFEMLWYAG